jgi:hypothetical protein
VKDNVAAMPMWHYTIKVNEYNNPSFTTMFQHALLNIASINTITPDDGLDLSQNML